MSNTATTTSNNLDLWIGEYDNVVTDPGPQNINDALSDPESILQPEIITNVDDPVVEELAQPEEVVEPPTEPEPELFEYEDGSSVAIEKDKRKQVWRATLDSGTGAQPEVFYGRTKDEMWQNVAVGKINATRKIRDLNKKVKLGIGQPQPEAARQPAPQKTGELTADDIFTLKAQLEENPALAIDTAILKKTGMTLADLAAMASNGNLAWMDQYRNGVDRDFCADNPDFLKIDDNYWAMVGWLAKYKLHTTVSDTNDGQILNRLVSQGLYTKATLEEAFDDLKESGLVTLAQPEAEEPEPEPVPQPQLKVRVRPRPAAGLGIRTSETRARRADPISETEPVIENLTLEQSEKLLNDLRRLKIQNPAEFERLKAIGEAKRRGQQV